MTGRKGRNSPEALARALRFERQGQRFYTAAASRSADPFAKQAFELLVDLEEKHYQDIRRIAREVEAGGTFPAFTTAPGDARMRLFRKELARIRREEIMTGESADAMRRALAFEAESREMYRRMAEAATHPREKTFFKRLAAEEESHFNLVYEYLDYSEVSKGLRMQDG